MSNENKRKNDNYDMYLWTKKTIFKKKVKSDLLNLIGIQKNELSEMKLENLKEDNIKLYLNKLKNYYELEKELLNNMEIILKEYSIVNVNFTQTQIDNFVEEINSYQWKLQRWNKDLIDFYSKTNNFLDTYKKSEEAIKKQIENLEKTKQIALKTLDTNNDKWNISKDKIEINYENNKKEINTNLSILKNDLKIIKKDKDIKLKTILNSIESAKISKEQAVSEYNKLTIKSPINWTIEKIFINRGQQVNPWVKLFYIINSWKPQIKISFSKEELKFIKKDMEVLVENSWEKLKARLVSFSKIADVNLRYYWVIKLNNQNNSFWEVIKIKIPVKLNSHLIPLDLVRLSDKKWIWKVNILDWYETRLIEVKIGKVFWSNIEIIWCLDKKLDCENINIIIN